MQANTDNRGDDRRTFTERARRAQIVEAAIETIAELGYAKASFARIAERAGLSSTGLISYHFANKDELMEQIVVEVYTEGARFVVPRIRAESDASGMLRAYIESNLAFLAENREAMVAVTEVVSNLRKPDGTLRFDLATDEPQVSGTEWILEKGQEDGEFRPFDTRVMALAIRAAIDRSAGHFAAHPDLDWKAYAREMASVFEHATRKTDMPVTTREEEGE
ncbi:transcriptional regulator, TetR family [Rubrobacter radiotolerans DSM 5868]|nr:transcriptional regulator, TetR family [Rubrobacter radiotolerans DSM 5868]